ncbi:DUF3037 domain-containing protein [Pseudochryseolinea flava]|uniref:DUF3037 domain-containing protein n=1 Tax=Pseudochryseolinea flava TaxID=2059302 RepID=A0A364Y796_9BACT|nr:DUF3037 domain-containing protein [Pseudochryseolinea flava]RAW02941.1 DUF3037 domain-containing protein [Pseudochryseolinea flava]
MQESHLFEYAVIRVVPRVEREEFLNIGVILLCAKQKFLRCRITLQPNRLNVLCATMDCDELHGYIAAFEKICAGGKEGGTIGALSIAERFRWLTATRSTIVQTSKVHPGLCHDPQEMLDRLFEEMVA